jgi:L-arabinonolactonase
MTDMAKPYKICAIANLLGEGVIWDHRTQKLQWTDIESSCLWQWDMTDALPVRHALPERLGSFALTPDPAVYLGAFENGFARFSVEQPVFEMLAPVTQTAPHLRMNDGRVDRSGAFWAGSMAEKEGMPSGALWRYDGNGKASAHLHNIQIPNSLCWNGAGDIMYFADSPRNIIWAYGFDAETGQVGEPRIFAQTPPGIHPDGSCIDAEDCLWNAHWGSGEIVRYRPDGSIDRRLSLPVSQPSCVAFAGPNLDLLCITTARVDLDDAALASQPLSGALFVFKVGVTGRQEEICNTGPSKTVSVSGF